MSTDTQRIEVVMPQMGVSVSEGTVTRWLKQPGEHVERDETLLEISTDKVDTEVPSPGEGVLTEILVGEGQTVDVGTLLAVIGGAGAAAPVPAAPAEPAVAAPEPVAAAPPEPIAAPPMPVTTAETGGNGRTFVSPVVARIAAEHGVDPSGIAGTGQGGRVTKRDILSFIEQGGATPPTQPAPPAAAPAVAPPQAPVPAAPAPAPPVAAVAAAVQAPVEDELLPGEVAEPMTAMRRGVMAHMRKSLDTSAHVTSAIEVDMSRVVAAREALKADPQKTQGTNPTYLAFIARATVETLASYPWINAEIRGEKIITRSFVNLGIAVALDEGRGLIVPVIRNAQDMNLLGIARSITDLAQRARTKKLLPDDVQGGTFTITNPGGFGTFHGTPIINQPQVGILGTYALVKRPWVVQDSFGKDVIAIRPLMNLTLTYDHRLVDGAYSGGFMKELRDRLEGWEEGSSA
ncbi:MAG: dihydrolipoamide acetyltransferase family protein [Gaiellales bacterium]